MANTLYKNITSIISTKQEKSSENNLIGSELVYTKCSRIDLNSKGANYFISFRLPHTADSLSINSNLSLGNPHLQQLNVDDMAMIPIPRDQYNEMIDGRSLVFDIPHRVGSNPATLLRVVSSTYTELSKTQNSPLLGNNIAFLFCDDINKPRTGTTNGGAVSTGDRSTWEVGNFVNRPVAHAYSDLFPSDINTDQRPWSAVSTSNSAITENYPTTTNQGYNYDIPVGYVSLDKGFIVLTHKDIVSNIPWDLGFDSETDVQNSSGDTSNIYFSGSNIESKLKFVDVDTTFKTSVVCLALPAEFVFSTNPSWNLDYNLQELGANTNGFDPISVTEIGLYNKNSELIAIAKLSEPVEKSYTGLITFNLDIEV